MAALLAGCGSDDPSSATVVSSSSDVASSSSVAAESSSFETPKSSAEVKSSSSSVAASSAADTVETSSSSAADTAAVSSASNATDAWYFDDAEGACEKCDSYTAQDPVLNDRGGTGSITTYGSITEKETSLGGACNYGQTNIQYYAAIHVNVSSGDDKGPWNGGLACGGCVRVKAKTPDGWKRVTVRITDRCPDESCGVDLGGAPASDIMGNTVGRYYGEWEFVSCEGVDGVWGDSTSIWVKEGASAYWSVIQVRNPKDAVKSISINGAELPLFSGAENFWEVPQEILQSDASVKITATYRSGTPDVWTISGAALTEGEANYYLYDYRE
ncbi:MAG: RlpA-like double-psi beta-barrel domain-containing protein [Fibrobacter sp.]|nr:RlpA-like double-psi beta-barrel domain-containing protein [Fibrobacter sp.]